MDTKNWAVPAKEAFYLDKTTHVWLFSLTASSKELNLLKRFLNEEDIKRAERFKFDRHRNGFIAAHGKMNFILAKYLHRKPDDIKYIQNEYGKPFIKGNPLYFNLSHSQELGLLAVNGLFEVGVDIEYIRPDFAELKIAKRFFSEHEVNELLLLPAGQRKQGFFNCWSRKEAYIKGQGKGLSIPLHRFDVRLSPGRPARLLATRDDPQAVHRWRLIALDTHPEYAAAVLVPAESSQIKLWRGDELDYRNSG